MKKDYVKPITTVLGVDMPTHILSGSDKITGDISGETSIFSGGSSDNDPDKEKGGDAKPNFWDSFNWKEEK